MSHTITAAKWPTARSHVDDISVAGRVHPRAETIEIAVKADSDYCHKIDDDWR
jgi:hypothetical protein